MENLSSAIYLAVARGSQTGSKGSSGTGIDPRHIKAVMQIRRG